MIALSLLSLLLATAALALPTRRDNPIGACDVPASAVTLPQSFNHTPSSPSMVMLGVGSQNYTCNSKGIYEYVGAYAQMYDISCLYDKQTPLSAIPSDAYNSWNPSFDSSGNSREMIVVDIDIRVQIKVYGVLYSTRQNGVVTPVWSLNSYENNGNAIMHGQEVQSVPSSNGASNVNWVEYKTSPNGWANSGIIYGVNTVGGQPPSGCTPGSSNNVKFTSNYYFV